MVDTENEAQFVDANNEDGDMVLIQELEGEAFGRCGWTIVE